MNKCVNCGFENNDRDEVCVNCGSQLSSDVTTTIEVKKPNIVAKNIKIIIGNPKMIKICLVILLTSILAIVFFSFQTAMFRYEKSVYYVDILMLVFWSIAAFISITILVCNLIMKAKNKK